MSSIVDEALKEAEDLEKKREEVIQKLLAERQRIDEALVKLGHKRGKGRPAGSKNKSAGKASGK